MDVLIRSHVTVMLRFKTGLCGAQTCRKIIDYDPILAYQEKGEVLCPECIERRINPMRVRLGKFPIPISKNAYSVESYEPSKEL